MVNAYRRLLFPVGVLLAATLASPHVHADAAAAEALFREGKKLMAAGDTAAACDKFAESQRLDASSGTLLNLADCHVKQGKTASAWAEFLAAARLARGKGESGRADEAQKRASALEGALSSLSIKVTEQVPGLEIKRDDVVLQQGSLSAKIPVDPGQHVISAAAPGYKAWTKTVTVQPGGAVEEVVIPKLERDASGAAAPSASAAVTSTGDAPPPPPRKSPTVGYVVGGAGLVLTGVGVFFGLSALSTYKDADSACPKHVGCSQDAADKVDSAKTKANIANVGVGLGVVGLAVGTYLVLSASGSSSEKTGSIRVAPAVGPSYGGAAMGGTF